MRWRSSITVAHALHGADCQLDHQLLACSLKLKLRNTIPRKSNNRLKIADQTAFVDRKPIAIHGDQEHKMSTQTHAGSPQRSILKRLYACSLNTLKANNKMSEDTWRLVESPCFYPCLYPCFYFTECIESNFILQRSQRSKEQDLKNICVELEKMQSSTKPKTC